jgi:hypothetical protein
MTYEWFRSFKNGRPSSSRSESLAARVKNVIHGNRRPTVREVAEEVGIPSGSCHTILTEDLGMHWFSAKFMPKSLTDDQKLHRFSICKNLQRANDDENLLKNVITGDETWVCSYNVETKQQSSHWKSCFASPHGSTPGALVSENSAVRFIFSIIEELCIMNLLMKVTQSRFLSGNSETSAECGTKNVT